MKLEDLLARSRAAEPFKEDVRLFQATGQAERMSIVRPVPRVKALRVVAQLLHTEPDLEIESLSIDGYSGCSDFTGIAAVACVRDYRTIDFTWDCRWRALREGWVDHYGFPDQIRAAREFDWRCFAVWRERTTEPIACVADGS